MILDLLAMMMGVIPNLLDLMAGYLEIHDHLEGCALILATIFQIRVSNRSLNVCVYLRILELANPPELLALDAAWVVGIALDLLFSTSDASNCQPLSWFPCLRHTPMRIHNFAVDDCFAMRSIVVKVAHSFAWYFS